MLTLEKCKELAPIVCEIFRVKAVVRLGLYSNAPDEAQDGSEDATSTFSPFKCNGGEGDQLSEGETRRRDIADVDEERCVSRDGLIRI